MNFSNMNVNEFINAIVEFDDVNAIMEGESRRFAQSDSVATTQSEKGFIYERLWDICIKFGFCSEFPNRLYTHMVGNVNNANIKPLTSFNKYLTEKVFSGNSGGCSDITLYCKSTDTYIFISSKYPKENSNEKSVDYYDVQKLICMIDDNAFKKLIPGWNIDMSTISDPILKNMRQFGLMKLLYIYGGMICPVSFLCMKNLIGLYNKGINGGKMFLCETNDKNITSSAFAFYPSINFSGAEKNNQTVLQLIWMNIKIF